MDLISKLEIEWSKNFPGDPLPSNILREKCHNYVTLQNAIRRCEETIDNLNKKLQQEIFLKNFLENFTEKSLHAAESKNETDNALHADFITSKQTSISTIGSLITETVSISTVILKEDTTQTEQDNSVDGQISKNADIKKVNISENFKKLACMNFECPIQVNDDHLTDENIPTNVNNQEHFKPKFKNKFGSYAEPTSSDLKLKTNQQIFNSLSSDSVYTDRKHNSTNNDNALQTIVASKKAIPPSLPPKPKKKHLSNVASCVVSNAKSNNNDNNKHCSDNIKTNVSQNTSLNAAADPHEEVGEQLPSDCFHSVEVGNCLDFCANDVIVKAGLIKSGAKPVKSSVKQVAANSLSVFKQQRGLTSTTGVDSATTVVPPNIVVKATGNSDNRNINFNDVLDYSCCNDIFQSTVEYKDLSYHQSTQEESGKRKSLDIAGYENKKPKPPVPTKKSIQSKNFKKSFQSENKFDCPNSSFQQTVADECQKESEYPTKINNKNREEKESVEDRQLILNRKELSDEENVNNEEENVNKNIKAQSESTGDSSYHNTDDTDMSTFKKQKEDICFVSYRKLDTEFYESPFTNNSTLPMLERRSSLLKDGTISENLPQITKDAIFGQEQNLPPLSLARNSTFKTSGYGDKDDTKKELYENYDQQFGIQSKSVDLESDFSINPSLFMTDTESPSIVKQVDSSSVILDVDQNVDNTESTGVCQDADQKVVKDGCIEVKKNDSGHYKTCIELTDDDDDDDSDSSEKKIVKSVTSGNQQSISNSEDDSDEEIVSIIYENQQFDSLEDKNLLNMRKQAIRQFLATEEIFVETLENIQKLMDQFSATIDSKESFLSKTDFEIMFFKISEILSLHKTCIKQLAPKVQNWQNNETVGTILKELMVHFPVFEEYTKNYPSAVETINKCSQVNGSFKRIAEEASFNPEMQKISLSVLLYKPISQLQFNTSFIQELLQYTPKSHADYEIIENTWRLTQHSLTGITNKNYDDKTENDQYLLKSDYLVELVGNVRKLRCFFLFNDVLVCTKQKFWQKSSFDVKWFIPISQLLLDKPDNDEMKYHSTEAVDEIKRKISCLETEIRKVNDKDKLSDRAKEKLKKKISELQRELTRLSGYLEFILKHNKKAYTLLMSTDYAREEWKEALYGLKDKCVDTNFTGSEVQQLISNCKKLPNISSLLPHQQADKIEEHGLIGSLCVTLHELTGLDESCTTYCCLELDSWGQFFTKAHSVACNGAHPVWNEEFELELDYSHTLRILCYKKGKGNQGDILLGKSALALSKDWLSNFTRKPISMNKISLVISINHLPPNKAIQRIPSKVKTGTFGVDIQKIAHHQDRLFPAIISICTQEIEKRGLHEVGIYRVSGGQSDVKRLKLAFQKNTMKARKMIADPDFNIHAVAAVLKLFFRELPEPLFTNALHNKFLTVNDIYDAEIKKKKVIMLIHSLPDVNYHTLIHLLHHLQRISENSAINKMTNSNLAVIFGQSLMQPAPYSDQSSVEMASFLNAHLQNDVLEYIMNLQCSGVFLTKVY